MTININDHVHKHKFTSLLMMSDGTIFLGNKIGSTGKYFGEICFTTSMTGYQHTITDPSYQNQIINFTFPHIGNVGTNEFDYESKMPMAKGIAIRENITNSSHSQSIINLNNWMEKNKISGICNIDTRALTKIIRQRGAQNCLIYSWNQGEFNQDAQSLLSELKLQETINYVDLSLSKPQFDNYMVDKNNTRPVLAVVDFGIKHGILRSLERYAKYNIVVIKANNNFADEILNLKPVGILLSNGPGDPHATSKNYANRELEKILNTNIPIFGICLGHQILSLTLGLKTEKMNNGHRGSNHPIMNLEKNTVEITSQNHGFTVSDSSIPENIIITHRSLFDNTIAGIKVRNRSIFSVQYHPEGSPGPHDSQYLFDQFITNVKQYQNILLVS